MRRAFLLLAALGVLAPPAPARAADPGQGDLGKEVFANVCAACHGEHGVGTDGVAPPLVDAALWDNLGDASPAYVAGVLASGLSGRITVGGQDYIGLVMPPQSESGTPEELVAAANYLLGELNRTGQMLSRSDLDAAIATPLTHKQLREMRAGRAPTQGKRAEEARAGETR